MNTNLIDKIYIDWKQILHAMKKSAKCSLRQLPLTKVDANILFALTQKTEITEAQLADYLSFKPASLTRSLDRLIESQFIKRVVDSSDHRFVRLSLTDSGHLLANQYIEIIRQLWKSALKDIDESEIENFELTLQKIQSNLMIAV